MVKLGMADGLKMNGMWEIPPLPSNMCEIENEDTDVCDINDELHAAHCSTQISKRHLQIN